MITVRIKLNLIYIALFFSVTSQANAFEVSHAGALKNFMRKGDISAQFDLQKLKGKSGLYALGALENLKGEIQIFNGVSFNTFTSQKKVAFDKSFKRKASLLVYTQVDKWEGKLLPPTISSRDQLEKHIAKIASFNGINTEKPFPFLLEGKAKSLSWHVINWKKNDKNHTHKKHIESGPHGTIKNKNVIILGFYSTKHKAIFTHHSTNIHMHFKTADHNLAGHIDKLILGDKMIIKLPKMPKMPKKP